MKKIIKIILFVLVFGVVLFTQPAAVNAKGMCSWGGPPANSVFWNPNLTFADPDLRPFLFSFDRLYNYEWAEPSYLYKDNSAEWIDYCSMRASRAEVDSFVYASKLADLENVLSAAKANKLITGKFKGNTMAKYLKDNQDLEALEYLVFAKKCEPNVSSEYYNPWEEAPQKNVKLMRQLYGEGQKAAEKAVKPIFKLRYAYQAVRLAHYAGDYSQAIGTYDKLIEPIESKSVIKSWALGSKAGALMQSGKRAEALYLFSVLFDKCPSKRVNMYYSFRPQSDDEWTAVMNKCKNNREKTTLHLIRAINPYAQATEEMDAIYALDPASDYLTLLLVREINKLETNLMDYDFKFDLPIPMDYKPEITDDGSQMNGEYLYTFKKFVSRKVSEKKVKDLRAWQLAEGYLNYLTGDFSAASQTMQSLEGSETNTKVKTQIQIFRFLLDLSRLKTLDKATEERIYKDYLTLGFEDKNSYADEYEFEYAPRYVYDCMRYNFARCYRSQGEKGKAFVCENGIKGLFAKNTDVSVAENALSWATRPTTTFEKHLLEREFNGECSGLDVLLDVIGTCYLRKNDLQKAKSAYAQVSSGYQTGKGGYFQIYFNPFELFIFDWHNTAEMEYGNSTEYNKLWVVERMIQLENEATQNSQKAAENYFKLGNAWYNMTYFAPGWRALMYARSGGDLYFFDIDPDDYFTKERLESYQSSVFFDVNPSVNYYQKALTANPAKDLGAKVQFGIAKCKQSETYTKKGTQKALDQQYEILKTKYSDTKYYAELIWECSYFKEYVRK